MNEVTVNFLLHRGAVLTLVCSVGIEKRKRKSFPWFGVHGRPRPVLIRPTRSSGNNNDLRLVFTYQLAHRLSQDPSCVEAKEKTGNFSLAYRLSSLINDDSNSNRFSEEKKQKLLGNKK